MKVALQWQNTCQKCKKSKISTRQREMRFVRYSGGDDFAMFSHMPTNDVLEAIHFNSYKEAAKYLYENRNGLFGPDTTFPRQATITTSVKL
jgi:hypothetical protein